MELTVSVLVAIIFTGAISFGYGKRMTESAAGRPVLGAIGFLIVIAGYSWHRHDFALFTELTMWFIVCCFPVLFVGVVNAEREKTALSIEQHKPTTPSYMSDGRA